MMATLVERLREEAEWRYAPQLNDPDELETTDLCKEAADRIEELERQLAEAADYIEELDCRITESERQVRIFYALSEERMGIIEATRAELATARQAKKLNDARVGIWQEICYVPDCDDELWFCRGDTYDGPRPPRGDDCDYWDYWCYAMPPALPEPMDRSLPDEDGK